MSRVEAAAGMDRLPWLPDEPQPRPVKRRGNPIVPWAAAAILAVAAGGFWLGTRSANQRAPSAAHIPAPATTTVQLPELRPAEPREVRLQPERQVLPAPAPQVRPAPERELRIPLPTAKRSSANNEAKSGAPSREVEQAQAAPAAAAPRALSAIPKPWNPRVFAGAAGRVVQIGAFGSVTQAKRGWWYMVRAYPAVAHLPAVVRPARNSKGRTFYRFQIGTTSQAHSEVLCQRMEHIRFSCAVVGLPWKATVER